jgi:hypothetical protein
MRAGARNVTAAPGRRSRRDLFACAAFEVAAVALFVVARGLRPAPEGLGTHEQLGLPPCLLFASSGIPCPACGMTTAFAHAARGEPLQALVTQPFAALLALALAAGFVVLPVALAAGVAPRAVLDAVVSERLALLYLALLALAWIYKVVAL